MNPLRKKFIEHLRTNPNGRDQIECMLTNGLNGRCAMGLGLEGIGIDLSTINSDSTENKAYEKGAKALGFSSYPKDGTSFDLVWRLNDRGLTFSEVADRLEDEWDD